MRPEIAQKRLDKALAELKKHGNRKKALEKKIQRLRELAHPENYYTCEDCGELNRKMWSSETIVPIIGKVPKEVLCFGCRNKREQAKVRERAKEQLVGGTVMDVAIGDYNRVTAIQVIKKGRKYWVEAKWDESSSELYVSEEE